MKAIVSLFTYYTPTQQNPVTGAIQRVSMTVGQEVGLGLQAALQMAQQCGFHPDP